VSLLDLPFITAIRRNHALEHATVTILSERCPGLRLVGRSDWGGFTLYGSVEAGDVHVAVSEGLCRLHAGERGLAIHSRCGTNLATGVILAGLASRAALSGKRRSLCQKAIELGLGLGAAFVVAQPLGVAIQKRWTTSSDIAGLRVVHIQRSERKGLIVHRIKTTQG